MKIVIVEDHLMFREVIRCICVRELRYEVVGESETGTGGVELSCRLKPDLLILDLGLPDMSGFDVAKTVRASLPTMRILVLSCQLDDRTILNVERMSLHGYVDKNASSIATIAAAVTAIAAGKTFFSAAFQNAQRARQLDTASFDKILSDTEQEVLALVGGGFSDEEIGCRMGISPTTAQTHRSRILKKLRIPGTPKLMAFALNSGVARLSHHPPFPAG